MKTSRRALLGGGTIIAMWPFTLRAREPDITIASFIVEQPPEEVPQFARVYRKQLDNSALKVTIKTYDGMLMKSGELTQENGRWMLFDPDAVADKILDSHLVPLVQAAVDQIAQIDKLFRESPPDTYLDESGTQWRRGAQS